MRVHASRPVRSIAQQDPEVAFDRPAQALVLAAIGALHVVVEPNIEPAAMLVAPVEQRLECFGEFAAAHDLIVAHAPERQLYLVGLAARDALILDRDAVIL